MLQGDSDGDGECDVQVDNDGDSDGDGDGDVQVDSDGDIQGYRDVDQPGGERAGQVLSVLAR